MITSTRRIKHFILSAAGFAVFGLMAVSPALQANEIKSAMKSMKAAYRGAMDSSSIDEFARYAAKLQSGADAARSQTYSDDPSTYREGMQELQQNIGEMNQAIRSGDLSAAKDALLRIRATEKRYHKAVGA